MTEVYVFAATLAVQSLPFLAAPLMMALEHLAKRQPSAVRLGDQTAPSPLS